MTSAGSLNFTLGADTRQLQSALNSVTASGKGAGEAITAAFNNSASATSAFTGSLSNATTSILNATKAAVGFNETTSLFSLPFSSELGGLNLLLTGLNTAKASTNVLGAALNTAANQSGEFGTTGASALNAFNQIGQAVLTTIKGIDGAIEGVIESLARSNVFIAGAVSAARALGIPLSLSQVLLDESAGGALRLNEALAGTAAESLKVTASLATITGFILEYREALLLISDIVNFQPKVSLFSGATENYGAIISAFTSLADIFNFAEVALDLFLEALGSSKAVFLGFVNNAIAPAKQALIGLGVPIEKAEQLFHSFNKTVQQFDQANELKNEFDIYIGAFKQLGSAIESFVGSDVDVFNVAKDFQVLQNQLELTQPPGESAAATLQKLAGNAQTLGIPLKESAQGFVKLSAAARGTSLEGEKIDAVFQGVTTAATVMQLSASDTEGVLQALQQMISKGTVSAEELRGQLGERLPGAFQIAARSMGVTTAELDKLLQSGSLAVDDFLPKFAAQLSSDFSSGLTDSMDSATAAVNRFQNSLLLLQKRSGDFILPIATPAIDALSKALDFLASDVGDRLFQLVDALLVNAIVFKLIPALYASATAAITAAFGVKSLAEVLPLLNTKIGETAKALAVTVGQYAASYVAVELFYRVLDRVKSGAGSTAGAIKSLDKSLQDLNGALGKSGQALSAVTIEPPPLDWIDAGVKALKDFQETFGFVGQAAVFLLSPLIAVGLEVNKLVNFVKTGNYEIVTAAEKALNDQLVAISDFSGRAQEILSKSLEFRQRNKGADGELGQLKAIEVQLKRIQQARLNASPKDETTLKNLADEETAALQRKYEIGEKIRVQQTANNNALTQAKQELQNLDVSKLGTAGFAKAKEQLEAQIVLLEKEKNSFDELIKQAPVVSQTLVTNFEKSTKALEQSYSDTQANIEELLAKGKISQEQADADKLASERKYLEDRLKLNQDAAAKLRKELEDNAKLKAIDPTKTTLTAAQEKDYTDQVEKIEIDSAKTRLDIAKNLQSGRKALNDAELSRVKENQAEAEAILTRAENSRIASIKQRQAAGKISEEQATKEIEAVQNSSIKQQVANEQGKLADIAALKKKGVITAKDAADQERDINNKLSELNLQRIDAELKARKDANDKVISEFESGIKRAEAAISQSENARKQSIAKSQLSGMLSPEAAARAEGEAERAQIKETLTLRQQQLSDVQSLRERGVIGAKDAADRERDILSQIGDLQLNRLQSEIKAQDELKKAREEATKKQLESVGKTAAAELSAVQLAETNKITAIKNRQALGLVTEQDAAAQIAAINQQSSERNIAIKEAELAKIKALRQAGGGDAQAIAEQERAAITEIANLRSQAADANLAKIAQQKRAQIDALDEEVKAIQTATASRLDAINLEKEVASEQINLLSAQSNLLDAQTGLYQQRLQFQIDEADKAGKVQDVERLKKQLLEEQIRIQKEQTTIAQTLLKLKQEQNQRELESQLVNANIARSEAQIAIYKAILNNASAVELAHMRAIEVSLNRQVNLIQSQIAAQGKINALESQTLNLQQQKTAEALKQQQVQLNQSKVTAQQVNQSSSRSSGTGTGSSAASSLNSIQKIADRITDLGNKGTLADAFNAAQASAQLKFNAASQSIGAGLGTSDITRQLNELIAATRDGANRPNLSISNVDDLGTAGRIYSDLSRTSARGAGL